ncbi:uncharacterized protein [Asterias amurensis]|uniref:uncharacterized protein n=1 Tax=Asterias amurensis TaxID=7602 RepID=UPI003AB49B06
MDDYLFDIESDQYSASSVRPPDSEHGNFSVDNAMIEIIQGAGAWCPDFNDADIWFQVDCMAYIELHGVAIQGRASNDEWVTSFRISHSLNGTTWTKEGGAENGDKIFAGTYDRTTAMYVLLDEPVVTRFVRILPVEWHKQPCMRIELLGFKDGNLPTYEDALSQETTTPQWLTNHETTPLETTQTGTNSSETTGFPVIQDLRSEVTGSGLTTKSTATLFETTSSKPIVSNTTTGTGTKRTGKATTDPSSTPTSSPMTNNLEPTEAGNLTQMGGTPPAITEKEAQEKISTASDVEDVYSALITQEGAVTSQTAKLALQAISSLTMTKSSSSDRAGQTETVTKTLGAVSSAAGKDKDTAKEFLKVCDSLLSDNSSASLQIPDDETSSNSSSSSTSRISAFLFVVDDFAASVTENLLDENTTEVIIRTDNLVLQSWSSLDDRISNDVIELTPNSSQNNFVIPASLVSGKQVKATSIVFKTLHSAISSNVEGQNSTGNTTTGSEVMSLTLSRQNGSSVAFSEESPVVLSFKLKQNKSSDYEAKCCFWKYTNDSTGGTWSTDGCRVHESSSGSTVCHCEHLTNFAVLLQLRDREIPAAHSTALDILTYIGAILSITALLAAIFMFCFLRLLKSQRVIIHVNLAASLAMAQLLYLTSIGATSNKGMCKAIAALLHYLFTASFLWMLVEGVHLYTKSVAVFGKGLSTKIYLLVGWGIPLVIVGIALGVRFDGYGTESSCWLSLEGGLIYAFVTPVLVVVVVNTLILVMVIRVFITLKANTDKSEKERIRAGIRAVLLLQPLLGFTWIFGLFSSFDDTFFFTYLFVIFNSSQGVFIFLLHCVGDYEVKKAIKKLRGRRTVSSSSTDYSVVQQSRLTRKHTLPTMVIQAAAPSTSRPMTSDTHAPRVDRNEPHLTAKDLAPLRLKKRELSQVSLSSKEAWGLDGMDTKVLDHTKSNVYAIHDSDRTYGVQGAGATPTGLPDVKTE